MAISTKCDTVGLTVGVAEGSAVLGLSVGANVGTAVGAAVDGVSEGIVVAGACVGEPGVGVGSVVGLGDGITVG